MRTLPLPALTRAPVDLPPEPFPQQYSALGLPLSAQAWKEQDAVDDRHLRRVFTRQLGHPTATRCAALRDPRSIAEQAQVLDTWLAELNADPQGALVLELMPTEMDLSQAAQALADHAVDLWTGAGVNDFRVGAELGLIRFYHRHFAATLRARGLRPRGLVVPYSNTPENVVASLAEAQDGARRLLALLEHARPGLPIAAVGFSQGAAAIRRALEQQPERLDRAFLLAPMGGARGEGEHGVWAGRIGRTHTLAIVNADDPARQVHAREGLSLLWGALNFLDPQKRLLGGKGGFHGGFYGDPDHPLKNVPIVGVPLEGVPRAQLRTHLRAAAREAGVFAYPVAYTSAVTRRFVEGGFEGSFSRRGDWSYDLREELVLDGREGRPLDPTRTRRDPDEVAGALRG